MSYATILKNALDAVCVKTAAVVGTGIHIYSAAITDNRHFDGICEDLASGHPIRGILKAIVPFLLPYSVSFYARRNAKRESAAKISELEKRVDNAEGKMTRH